MKFCGCSLWKVLKLPVPLESPFTQSTICLLSPLRSCDQRPSNRTVGQRIRVPLLFVRHVCRLHFGLDATSMQIPCNKRNTATSFSGSEPVSCPLTPSVHKPSRGGCVPRRTSVVAAPCLFPACGDIWIRDLSLACSQGPLLGRALSNLHLFTAHWTAINIAATANCAAERCSNSVDLFLTSPPVLVRYCFTASCLFHLVSKNNSLHFSLHELNFCTF